MSNSFRQPFKNLNQEGVLFQKTGEWKKLGIALALLEKNIEIGSRRGAEKAGKFLVQQIKAGITRESPAGKKFKPLHPRTAQLKTGSILKDSKLLYNAVTYGWDGKKLFIGVPEDSERFKIAKIHEYGAIIASKAKPEKYRKVVKWLAWQGFLTKGFKGTGKGVIKIPARPFINPIVKRFESKAIKIFQSEINKMFGGI